MHRCSRNSCREIRNRAGYQYQQDKAYHYYRRTEKRRQVQDTWQKCGYHIITYAVTFWPMMTIVRSTVASPQ